MRVIAKYLPRPANHVKFSEMETDIYIVGGGASGLVAAASAAGRGARVAVLEKMKRPARKLEITGNGRCNITTGESVEAAMAAFGPNGRFLRGAFSRFFSAETVAFFARLGVPIVMNGEKKYFPASGGSIEIASALTNHVLALGVDVRADCAVTALSVRGGSIAGMETAAGPLPARRVLLATGGASYPATGSTGDGYALAASVGHSIIRPLPALVPLILGGTFHRVLAPLTFNGSRTTLALRGRPIAEAAGGILFAPFGATGPAALHLGKHAAANAGERGLSLIVNFMPGEQPEALDKRLAALFSANGRKKTSNILTVLLPRRAAAAFAAHAEIPETKTGAAITVAERARLVSLITSCEFAVKGTKPLTEAMVTAGGVSLNEVDPRTMQSKLVKGLFFSGELLDIDAVSGGFNLQAAFSTGYVAGCSLTDYFRGYKQGVDSK